MPSLIEFAKKFMQSKGAAGPTQVPPQDSIPPTGEDWVEVEAASVRPSHLTAPEDQDWHVIDSPDDRAAVTVNLQKVRAEHDLQKKLALCRTFLHYFADHRPACAEVEDLLAEALKTWGIERAKKAYEVQMKGEDSPEHNPGKKFDPKHLDERALIELDLTDHTGSGLTEAEVLAIRTYTASNYKYINPAVANQKDRADRTSDWMDVQNRPDPADARAVAEYEKHGRKSLYEEGALHAGMILEAFKKLPKMSGKLYRGARMNQARFTREYAVGKEIVYEAFVSSAVQEHVARGFADGGGDFSPPADATISVFVEAEILDARDIMKLSVYGDSEQEWLVPPGTKLRVEKIEDDPVQNVGRPPATAWKKVYLQQIL